MRHPTNPSRTFRSIAKCLPESSLIEQLEPRRMLVLNPTGQEQEMLELLNRFRLNPAAELTLLTTALGTPARSGFEEIDNALVFFNVNGAALASQWSSLISAPPLAWNEDLYQAAEFHTQQMIAGDVQSHQLPGEPALGQRATNAGYNWSIVGENIYAYAKSPVHGHAGFAIDWGNDDNGIQNPPGHRTNMMDSVFREVGIRIITEESESTDVGPLVVTQDFGNRFSFGNPFLLGVVFDDADESEYYDSGEGLGGVTITATGDMGTFVTTSFDEGGYQMQVPAGSYTVTFSGGGLSAPQVFQNIVVASQNRKLDAEQGSGPPAPEIAILGNSAAIADGDTTPDAADHTGFGTANITGQTVTRTFTLRNDGNLVLNLSGTPRVVITGAGASSFSVITDAPTTLAAGGSTTFQIRFDPSAAGVANATVTITSDDSDEGTYTFAIRGMGLQAPEIGVKGNNVAIVDGDTTPGAADLTTFGSIGVAGFTKVRTYTIFNTGSATLNISGVTMIGTNSADYEITLAPAATIAPGNSSIFRVRFNPSALGQRNATVRILSDDSDESPYTFAVRGTGIQLPEIELRGNGRIIASGDTTPRALDWTTFGSKAVAGQTGFRTFVIKNIRPGALNLTGTPRVRIVGANPGDFSVTILPPATIAGNTMAQFRVRFDPTAVGTRNAIVRIVSNDSDEGTYTFAIRGVGV